MWKRIDRLLFLKDFSTWKGSSLQSICNANTAFLLWGQIDSKYAYLCENFNMDDANEFDEEFESLLLLADEL